MEKEKKILIIDSHEIFMWALQSIIQDTFKLVSIFSASSFDEGLAILEKHRVNQVIVDIDIAGGNNPGMIEKIRRARPGVKVLVYTAMSERDHALHYLAAGAHGFLSKTASVSTLRQAMQDVLEGRKYLSAVARQAIADSFFEVNNHEPTSDLVQMFTRREQQVARLMLQGKWTKEISDDLGIKLSTVSSHKSSIFEKMQVRNVVELFRKVQKEMPDLLEEIPASTLSGTRTDVY
jgi:two-component system, NarL family, invasion response regulator UvrY